MKRRNSGKNKVCIITPSTMPLPAVQGGAIETLIDMLINENEVYKRLDIVALTVDNQKAQQKAKDYKATIFVTFPSRTKIENFYNKYLYRCIKHFTQIMLPDRPLRLKMVKFVAENQEKFDWILFEAGEVDCMGYYKKYLPKQKILLHLHWCAESNKKVENTYEYLIPISKYVGQIWMKNCGRNENTVKVLQNCIDVSKFNRRPTQKECSSLRAKLGLSADDFIVIFTGRIVWEKGVVELLDAMSSISDKSVKLLLIGSARFGMSTYTSYEQKVEGKLKSLGGRVVFTGFIPNAELYKYYGISEISIIPSVFEEPAGLVALEAMASGKPIITTGSGGLREYCDESCAVFVNRGNKLSAEIAANIIKLKNDEELRKNMASSGVRKAQDYNQHEYYESFVDILEEISSSDN